MHCKWITWGQWRYLTAANQPMKKRMGLWIVYCLICWAALKRVESEGDQEEEEGEEEHWSGRGERRRITTFPEQQDVTKMWLRSEEGWNVRIKWEKKGETPNYNPPWATRKFGCQVIKWRYSENKERNERWWATQCNSGCKVWQEWRLSLPSCKNPQPAPEQQHHDHIGDDNSDADYDDMIMTTMVMINFLHWRFHRRISNQHYDAPSKLNVSDQCEPNKLHDEGSIGDVAFLPFALDSCALTPTVPSLVQLVPLIVLSW